MHPEILSISLFWFVTAYTPGPNNVVASYSGFNFGIKKTIPHILGTTLGFTSLVLLLTIGLINVFKLFGFITEWTAWPLPFSCVFVFVVVWLLVFLCLFVVFLCVILFLKCVRAGLLEFKGIVRGPPLILFTILMTGAVGPALVVSGSAARGCTKTAFCFPERCLMAG